MAVAYETRASSSWTSTPDPLTLVVSTAVLPRAVIVTMVVNGASTDQVTGMTYGGVTMTRVPTNGFAADSAGETGTAYIYFLGSGIPTGSQTLSVDHSGSADNKRLTVYTCTAAADTQVAASGRLQGDQANPQIALDSGADSALRFCVINSGLAAPTDLTMLSGMTEGGIADWGNQCMRSDRQTTASSGSFTIGYTASSDDVAMCAVAVAEAGGAADPLPRRPVVRSQAVNRSASF